MGGVPGGTAQAGKCHPLSRVSRWVESSFCIFPLRLLLPSNPQSPERISTGKGVIFSSVCLSCTSCPG